MSSQTAATTRPIRLHDDPVQGPLPAMQPAIVHEETALGLHGTAANGPNGSSNGSMASTAGKSTFTDDDTTPSADHALTLARLSFLTPARPGSWELVSQIASLRFPRLCFNDIGDIVDRFVTDDDVKSGRCYDRLNRVEVPRIIPFPEEGGVKSQCYDVLTDRLRTRMLFDDLRDTSVGRPLEVSLELCGCVYYGWNGNLWDEDNDMSDVEVEVEDEDTEMLDVEVESEDD